MKYYCNPINVPYRYQFNADPRAGGKIQVNREAADPSMIFFQGKYYIFVSMNLSVWVSEDMVNWEAHRLPEDLPLYDYAPDVSVCGDTVYFCASKKGEICHYYKTKDIIHGPYERIEGSIDFWDPHLFFDEDGKVYFYWGCSNTTPIWGVELEKEGLRPKGQRLELIGEACQERGYERSGEDHTVFPRSKEETELLFQEFIKKNGLEEKQLPSHYLPQIRGMFSGLPYIEGAWMNKHRGKYYLQYACPGTQYNGYADGVYVGTSPLGPFVPAENNPFSYHPGGFMPGAGHGSTMWDRHGALWHASTMRISANHVFERRVGIWRAGFDEDGELFCNQNYGDWPIAVEENGDPWSEPEWFLLSYAKPARASGAIVGKGAEKAFDEKANTWWQSDSKESGQWLEVDLQEIMDIRAVQINFADDDPQVECPGQIKGTATQPRYIEERDLRIRWKLEASLDAKEYFDIEDKSEAETDLPHDFIVREEGLAARYVRLTIIEVPYGQAACISGLRIFGKGQGEKPAVPAYHATRSEDGLDLLMTIRTKKDAVGYNILWGHKRNKLYHSYQIYRQEAEVKAGNEDSLEKRIGALVKNQAYFVRVDAYNENGITKGKIIEL